MRAVAARLGVSSPVSRGEEESLQNSVLRRGCERLGFQAADIPTNSAHREHRCGWCGFGCWSGTKQSTAETWLADAVSSGKARIVTGVSATAVLRCRQGNDGDGDGRPVAVGLVAEASASPGLLLFVESRITVVSAGALCTPALLRRSGLRNRNIGRHLHLHPCHLVWGYFPRSPHAAYEGQIMTAMSSQLQLGPDGHGVVLQCPSVHPGLMAAFAPWLSPADFRRRMRRFARTASVIAIDRDRGAGAVGSHPLLGHRTVSYALDPRDERDLVEGAVATLRILIAAGASEVGTHHRRGDRLVLDDRTSEADVERFLALVRSRGVGRLGALLGSAHQMGSCRMGTHPRTSAVGPTGEAWELSNLFVADASVLPTALGVNPMITIESVSYCIAHEALRVLNAQA